MKTPSSFDKELKRKRKQKILWFNPIYSNKMKTKVQQDLQQASAQKMKFSIKDFFSKCDQILSFLQIWSHLLKKS